VTVTEAVRATQTPCAGNVRPLLNERQLQVLILVALGYSSMQIARELDMGKDTSRRVVGQLRVAFGVSSQAHVVAQAFRLGVLKWDEQGRLCVRGGAS
jgi:DNA-binding CsgD family transcriptional regulator